MSFFDTREMAGAAPQSTGFRLTEFFPGIDGFWDKRLTRRTPSVEERFEKPAVNYRPSKSGDPGSCVGCAHYVAPFKCNLVSGVIFLRGYCDKFEAKTKNAGNPIIP